MKVFNFFLFVKMPIRSGRDLRINSSEIENRTSVHLAKLLILFSQFSETKKILNIVFTREKLLKA